MPTHSQVAIGLAVLVLAHVLAFFFNPKPTKNMILDLVDDNENILLVSYFRLLVAFFVLGSGWKVAQSWEGLLALVGWLILLGGLFGIWFPEKLKHMVRNLLKSSDVSLAVLMLVVAAVGIGLGYLGLYVL